MGERRPSLPNWALVAAALLVPVLLAGLFITALDWSNSSVSPEDYRANSGAGRELADRNNALVFLHGGAQLLFLVAGAWWVKLCGRSRALFLLLAVPVSGMAFLASVLGSIAM